MNPSTGRPLRHCAEDSPGLRTCPRRAPERQPRGPRGGGWLPNSPSPLYYDPARIEQAVQQLAQAGIPTEGLSSKSWDVFAQPHAPHMDAVITVCDQAAGETCPLWPGRPVTAHWGYADPSAVQGGIQAQRAAFAQTLGLMRQRVQAWVALPPSQLHADVLSRTLRKLAQQP